MKYKLFGMALIFGMLSACGGGGGSDSDSSSEVENDVAVVDNTTKGHLINSFDVGGTSEDTAAGQAPISPGVKGGNFVLDWEVASISAGVKVSAYASLNNVLSENDPMFFEKSCLATVDCAQSNDFQVDCFFNNSNQMYCGGSFEAAQATDLSPFLDTIPKDGYIIFKSCDISGIYCDTASHPIQIQ